MEEFKVLRKGDFAKSNIAVLQEAKKLKTRGMDFINLKNTPATMPMIEEEIIEQPKLVEETPKSKPFEIEESKEEKVAEEIKEETKEEEPKIAEFAYHAHKQEEDIDPDAIMQIKELGEAYKGQPKTEIKKHVEEKKEEVKITEEEFLQELNKESYSPKTKGYKNAIYQKYNQIISEIEENKKQIEAVTTSYGEEKETGLKLQDIKSDSQKMIDGVNALDLNFLVNRKDSKSINILRGLEELFNEHRQIIIDTIQEIKKSDERKKEIGQKEQNVRNEGAELNNKKNKFIKDNFEKITSINEIDEETRKLEESLTEVTGISDTSLSLKSEETNRVLVSNVTNNLGETVNPFDRVRSDSVNPEIPSIRKVA